MLRCARNDDPELTTAELGAALDAIGGFEAQPRVAVAVSGGPDSLALTLLADRWARARGGTIYGLTVDHGLRPESAEEARTVAGWLAARGIAHETLAWTGDKPKTGIQEAARAARYDLLAAWCRRHGVLHLLTAHQRDDQVETYLIRRRAGSGIDGLAGMPAVRELDGCRLVRPLLAVPRAHLAAFLDAERQPFLRDPSNLNPAFERARLRLNEKNSLSPIGGESRGERAGERSAMRSSPSSAVRWCGQSPLSRTAEEDVGGAPASLQSDEIIGTMQSAAHERVEREAALDRLIGRAVAVHPAGFAAIDASILGDVDNDLAERLLARVAVCIGGGRYPARRERVARLRVSLVAEPERARTLGGCRFVPWRGRLLVLRELAAAQPSIAIAPGDRVQWDRRFAVSLTPEADRPFRLDYLRQSAAALVERQPAGLPPLIDPVLPAFRDADGLAVSVPHLGHRRAGIAFLPCLVFRPANPLTRAGFTVV